MVKIVRNEGPLALFRGLSAGLVMAVPSTVIYFVGYDYIRDQIKQSRFGDTAVHDYSPLWAGGVARSKFFFVEKSKIKTFGPET